MSQEATVVEIHDEVAGTITRLILPETAEQAARNCVAVVQAIEFAELFCMCEGAEPDPLAVVIRKTADAISIRWHVGEGADPEAARERLAAVQSGRALA